MKHPLIKTLIVLVVLIAGGAFAARTLWHSSPNMQGKVLFRATGLPVRTLDEARTLSQETGKPLLINFSAYWCSFCRRMDRSVFRNEQVRTRIEQDYIYVRLDSEDPVTRPLMERYGIHAYPTFMVARADGTPLKLLPVVFKPEQFLQAL